MTWRWLIPLSALPIQGLLAYGFRVNPREIPSPLVGQPPAVFALETFRAERELFPGHVDGFLADSG